MFVLDHDDVIKWKHFPRYWSFVTVADGFPLTKASDAEFRCYLWSVPEETVDQTIETPVIREAIVLIMTSLWCRVWHEVGTVAQYPKEYVQNGVFCFVFLPSVISECKWSIYSYSSRLLEPALTLYLLQWRHNERVGVSNHQCLESLRNRLFRGRLKKIIAPRHWPLWGESTGHGHMDSPHKGPLTRKMCPYDVIMFKGNE